jgi:hypothetical protein
MTALWCCKRPFYLALLGLIGVTLLAAGCSSVHPSTSVGTGTFSYITGALTWVYPVTIEKLWPVTLAEVEALRLQILDKHMDGLGADIKTVRADKIKVDFKLQPVDTKSTSLSVRIVDEKWHRKEAERIHAEIRERLGLKF